MNAYNRLVASDEKVFMGLDVHIKSWHLTVRSEHQEVKQMSIPPQWEVLRGIIERFGAERTQVVYEAGYFGYGLCDNIVKLGAQCLVTPPSLVPQESGNRVKTDKRDSSKLARLLSKSELKAVHVPAWQQRNDRQLIRHRTQILKDRTRVQLRIKSFLTFHGVECAQVKGKWSSRFVESLKSLGLRDNHLRLCLSSMLEQYEFLNGQILDVTKALRALASSPTYKESYDLLRTVPGVGCLTAMHALLELQSMSRFSSGEKLAAYVGLTPSQHSSGERVRLGHISKVGKGSLRGALTQAAWSAIRKDGVLAEKYERISARAGGKRAIVAVAHNLLLRMRRVLLDRVPYSTGVIG